MCVAVVTSLLAQFCGAWGATLWLPPASYWPSVLLGHTHTHTNYLSIIDTHTHICRRAHTHTSSPILISHSSSHRGLTDDSPRRAGGVKEVQSEAFGMGGDSWGFLSFWLAGGLTEGRWMHESLFECFWRVWGTGPEHIWSRFRCRSCNAGSVMTSPIRRR